MRSYWVLGITVILVLALDLVGRSQLNRMSREGSETAAFLESQQDMEALEAAETCFEENKWLLALLTNHSHRDEIEGLLAEARSALECGDRERLTEKARLLALAWQEPGQEVAITWGNLI